MAVNREQALSNREFHQPRAGRTCATWRVNGQPQLWKTRPDDFRVPLKHGLYAYAQLTPSLADLLFVPDECPSCAARVRVA